MPQTNFYSFVAPKTKKTFFINSIYKAEKLKESFYHPPCAVTFFKNLTKLSALLSQADVFL
jgi:hypothetical protein